MTQCERVCFCMQAMLYCIYISIICSRNVSGFCASIARMRLKMYSLPTHTYIGCVCFVYVCLALLQSECAGMAASAADVVSHWLIYLKFSPPPPEIRCAIMCQRDMTKKRMGPGGR